MQDKIEATLTEIFQLYHEYGNLNYYGELVSQTGNLSALLRRLFVALRICVTSLCEFPLAVLVKDK